MKTTIYENEDGTFTAVAPNLQLRAARELRGISQKTLAARAGVFTSQISLWELGSRKPSLAALCALAEALNVSTDALMGLTPLPASPVVPASPVLADGYRHPHAAWIRYVLIHGWEPGDHRD